ncbi:MAG: FG-GAP repeat protein [Planctomycetes bacterium]|nr:FG-GAP repeat protein [Planctomycetota bacterium]
MNGALGDCVAFFGVNFTMFIVVPFLAVCAALDSADFQVVGGEWNVRQQLEHSQVVGSDFGFAMYGQGDVDGDGVADLIVGAPSDSTGGWSENGSVFVYSGLTYQQLYKFSGNSDLGSLGFAVTATDLNNDGYADIIASEYFQATIYIWSGANGQLMNTFTLPGAQYFGEDLEIVADRDGDGINEILIGTSDATVNGMTFAGRVQLRSGATGALIHQWFGAKSKDNFEAAVTELGDITGDGIGEFAIGIPGWDFFDREGAIQVIDGATYVAVKSFWTGAAFGQLGIDLANPGDVNGDGVGDLLASATGYGSYDGKVYAFDGASQFSWVIYGIPGQGNYDFFGENIAAAGDVNQDGFADFLAGASEANAGGPTSPGYVDLYSGADGSLIKRWTGEGDWDHMGRVRLADDFNGDGDPEILLGANGVQTTPGYVKVVGLNAFLKLSARELSASSGTTVGVHRS